MVTRCLDKNKDESRIISCTTSTDSVVSGPKGVTTYRATLHGSRVACLFFVLSPVPEATSTAGMSSTASVFLRLILAFYPVISLVLSARFLSAFCRSFLLIS